MVNVDLGVGEGDTRQKVWNYSYVAGDSNIWSCHKMLENDRICNYQNVSFHKLTGTKRNKNKLSLLRQVSLLAAVLLCKRLFTSDVSHVIDSMWLIFG